MKKTALLILIFTLLANTVSAFNFPEPDWGSLLAEREGMATETDFELYTEGYSDSGVYYGAKFEPKGGCYIGILADFSEGFKPVASYLSYIDSMYQGNLYSPSKEMARAENVITTVGWTVNNLNEVDYNAIRNTLDTLNSYNKPMFIRFANEMNASSLGDDPERYKETFRNVANMVHEYENLAVVWSPNDFGALDRPFDYYYPGDEYVDWIGLSMYTIKYFTGNPNALERDTKFFMSGDYAWPTNRIKPLIKFLESNNIQKPIMISEGGVATRNKQGENLQSWATPRLRNMMWYLIMKYPQIKLINYFNKDVPYEHHGYSISNYPYASEIFKTAAESGAYIREYNGKPKFVFQPAYAGHTLIAENGNINLYTLAFFFGQDQINVNYWLDGEWYRAANEIPYICRMNINDFGDGEHTLKVQTGNTSKTYTFYKKGQCIRFGAEPDPEFVEWAERNRSVKVIVNGEELVFDDQPPVIINGRTLVPMRAIFEALGAYVEWDGETRTVYAENEDTIMYLTVDSNIINVNDDEVETDVPAQIINNRTLVPVRVISQSLGCEVLWDGETRTVTINQ